MAVSNTTTLVQYAGNNSAVTAYPITFPFTEQSWIKCQLLDEDGTVTDLVLDTDFTVTGEGDPSGGDLVTAVAYDNTHQLTIYRVAPLTQLLDLVYNDRLPAQLLEDALDKITYIAQQLSTLGDAGQRTLKFPISEPGANDDTLPVPADRLGKYLYFNELTGEMELAAGVGTITVDDSTIQSVASLLSVKNNGITNAKLAQIATSTVKARTTAGTGNVEDVTFANFLAALVSLGAAQQPVEVTGNVTATIGRVHHVTASATFTDPTPVQAGAYIVKVLNGTATVGAIAYSTYGTIIERSYHSGAWQTNRVYLNKAQLDSTYATAAQGALAATATQPGNNANTLGSGAATSGQVLTANGAGATSWQTQTGSPTIVTAQATTSGTAFDFSSIPNTVKEITIGFNGVSLSGTDKILVQIGSSGTPLTTGYTSTSEDRSTDADSTSGFVVFLNSAGAALHGAMTLTKLDGFWVSTHDAARSGNNLVHGGGSIATSTVDIVRVTRDGTNTFDAGSISIQYKL